MKLFFLLLTLSFFVDPAPTFQILPFGRLGGSGGEKPHLALPPPWIDTLPSYDVVCPP